MEAKLGEAVKHCGGTVRRAHPYDEALQHGFIASQKQGMAIFAGLDADAPIIVAEAVWQYSHHVLAGLTSHRGPILTVANWSGQWPGLVGMLNLNGSLTKAGVRYSTLWSEDFTDAFFLGKLQDWLSSGWITHDTTHVRRFMPDAAPRRACELGKAIAADLRQRKSIMGVFDEGCMGMYNAIIPDELLIPLGVFKERLSQSSLYAAARAVPEAEARGVYEWLLGAGMIFHLGSDPATELTEAQVLDQCRIYIAAVRIAEEYGCETIGIQYQQGLRDLLPASDLAEGLLNNEDRPPVMGSDGAPIRAGQAIPHFNEVDECAGLDALFTNRVHRALGQPVETTLHDLRWADVDRSGTTKDYVWVFEISGAAPPAHHVGGWRGTDSMRQPPMYFRLGGGSVRGVAKPGEIIWSRIFVEGGRLKMDIGRGHVADLPEAETERRWQATTPQWPIMHGVLHGVSRDQMMARHKANHIQVVYAHSAAEADLAMSSKAALAAALGLDVFICGGV
jgi:L-fucose isomerase-like protein